MLTFEDTELLFKNLDAVILCLPNKKKMLKKKKASPPLKQTSDTKMTDTKDDTEETVLKTAVCNTPLTKEKEFSQLPVNAKAKCNHRFIKIFNQCNRS